MNLVEKHLIKSTHRLFKEIDRLCFLSKNLYNCGVYICRQAIFSGNQRPTYPELDKLLKNTTDYKALPAKVSQQVLIQVERALKSYEQGLVANKQHPRTFNEPRLPYYKNKVKGRNILIYTAQAVSKKWLNKGLINVSKTELKIPTDLQQINQVRIIPITGAYRVEVIYQKQETKTNVDPDRVVGIDLGLCNLATVVSNVKGFKPLLICGKALKASNHYYNKRKSQLQSILPSTQFTSRLLQELTCKRNNKVDYYLHTASRFIINKLLEYNIGHLIIGKNQNWKHSVNLGHKNNQTFVQIPHNKLISMLTYKAELVGIKVSLTEESYTSKCSFVDLEPIHKHSCYLGSRVKRGLFVSANELKYNADCNGAGNV